MLVTMKMMTAFWYVTPCSEAAGFWVLLNWIRLSEVSGRQG
jgi:hypothetical protein